MAQYYPGMTQTFPPLYLPLGTSHASETPHATVFPPVQMTNFYTRPFTVIMDHNNTYSDNSAHQIEYHHLYGANPNFYSYPFRHFPQMSPFPLYNPYANYRPYAAYRRPGWDVWPEGFILRGELHWGRLERVVGPKRDVPEFVRDDLRRVYGTYPRTDISITYRNGEFIVKGDPEVGEQEYKIEKTIIRKQPTPSASEAEESIEDHSRKRKKKSKR